MLQPNPEAITSALVDELGRLKAQVSPINERIDDITKRLRELAPGRYAGVSYRVNVAVFVQERLDPKCAREHLNPEAIRACTVSSIVKQVRAC